MLETNLPLHLDTRDDCDVTRDGKQLRGTASGTGRCPLLNASSSRTTPLKPKTNQLLEDGMGRLWMGTGVWLFLLLWMQPSDWFGPLVWLGGLSRTTRPAAFVFVELKALLSRRCPLQPAFL